MTPHNWLAWACTFSGLRIVKIHCLSVSMSEEQFIMQGQSSSTYIALQYVATYVHMYVMYNMHWYICMYVCIYVCNVMHRMVHIILQSVCCYKSTTSTLESTIST